MRRVPWLTLAVAVVTVVGLVVQEAVPGTLENLERTPAALNGELWRWVSAMVVQDGGVAGGTVNLVGLLLCGVAAEQVVRRRVWAAAFVGAGLAGQVAGQVWQPVGAGTSVWVCGLAAVCVVTLVGQDAIRPGTDLVRTAPAIWLGGLGAALWTPLLVVGVVLGSALNAPVAWPAWTRHLVPGFCVAVGLALALDRDLHGAAFLVALVGLGVAATTGRGPGPVRQAGLDSLD